MIPATAYHLAFALETAAERTMATQAQLMETLALSADVGGLVTFRLPFGGDVCLAVQRHMIDDAMRGWNETTPLKRERMRASVLKHLKRGLKAYHSGKADKKVIDALAADACLWLGYELIYSNGETHLVRNITRQEIYAHPRDDRTVTPTSA